MNKTTEAYKDALSCPICMETLTTPKILSCGHSFCLTPCLTEIVKQHEPMCPLCRKPIVLPPSGKIEDLATNFSVKGLLEMLEKTEDQEKTSQTRHTQEDGDYVCMTCLEQVCSCCQLSIHTDNNHDCIPVSEFKEKVLQEVSKMVAVINRLSRSKETERYTTASSVKLQENISTACNEILQSLGKKKLDLREIRQLHKQVKKDHTKFKEVMKTQLADYRQKIVKVKLPESVYTKPSFRLKISSFENLKGKAEALCESLTQQLKTESLSILAMKEKLHFIGENMELIEQCIKDVTQDYHKFLLQEICITGQTVEPHFLFRVLEAVDVMDFMPDRFSEDMKLKSNKLIDKFQTSKDFIKTSCVNLFEEFHNQPFQLAIAERKIVKILEELEKCNGYFEDIYEVIGRNFVIYDNAFMKENVQHYLLEQELYVLQSKGKTQFMQKHSTEFESFKQTTKTQCKALIRYLSEIKDPDTSVVHAKLKAIEIRLKKTEYDYELLKNLSSMEVRCHEMTEEFRRLPLTEQTEKLKFRRCYEHKEEIQRIWNLIFRHKSTTILSDVNFITELSKTMEERRNNVVSLLMLSNWELNDFKKKKSKITQILNLHVKLHTRLHEFSNTLPCLYKRHQQDLRELNMVFDIVDADRRTKTSSVRSYTLHNLLLLTNQAKALDKLFKEVHSTFKDECLCACQIASQMRCKLLKSASGWFPRLVIPKRVSGKWNIPALTQEDDYQWKKVAENVMTDNFNIHVLESHLDRALLSHHKVNKVSTEIFEQCVKALLLFAFLVVLYLTKPEQLKG